MDEQIPSNGDSDTKTLHLAVKSPTWNKIARIRALLVERQLPAANNHQIGLRLLEVGADEMLKRLEATK